MDKERKLSPTEAMQLNIFRRTPAIESLDFHLWDNELSHVTQCDCNQCWAGKVQGVI